MKPLSSMTGFAGKSITTELGPVNCELKSVNSRFLEVLVKFQDQLRYFEPIFREKLQKTFSRGKFEVRLFLQDEEAVPTELSPEGMKHLLSLQETVLKENPKAHQLSVSQILLFPGVLLSKTPDKTVFDKQIDELFDYVLSELKASREREGEALGKILLKSCDQIDELVDKIEPRIPEIVQSMKDKLTERLEEALNQPLSQSSTLTPADVSERIRQEVILFAMKLDVQEEIGRLRTHVKECRRVIKNGGPVGRRLDFLMQELNREANTLGSKAAAIEMTDTSVNLKVVIEQMREQIQNLE